MNPVMRSGMEDYFQLNISYFQGQSVTIRDFWRVNILINSYV